MIIHVHLGPTTEPHVAGPKRQILLTRCQAKPRAGWVSASFHKDIQQVEGTAVEHRFKSLQKGALPGLVAWLLRKQAGSDEPLSPQVSDQLGELIVQSDTKRKETWLWALLGTDPRGLFCQESRGWRVGQKLRKAEVVTIDYSKIPTTKNLDPQSGTRLSDPLELKEIANSLLPPMIAIGVYFKRKRVGPKAWKRFDPYSDKLTAEHELKVVVACPDGSPRNIAVAGLTSKGEALGFWPWMPTPSKWDSPAEIRRIITERRNPKTEVSLPGLWNKDGNKSLTLSDGRAVHCLVVVLYHLENPTDANAHATTLKNLANSIKKIRLDRLLSPEFAATRSFVVTPVADEGIWRQLEKLPRAVKESVATGNSDIMFAEAVVLPTEEQ